MLIGLPSIKIAPHVKMPRWCYLKNVLQGTFIFALVCIVLAYYLYYTQKISIASRVPYKTADIRHADTDVMLYNHSEQFILYDIPDSMHDLSTIFDDIFRNEPKFLSQMNSGTALALRQNKRQKVLKELLMTDINKDSNTLILKTLPTILQKALDIIKAGADYIISMHNSSVIQAQKLQVFTIRAPNLALHKGTYTIILPNTVVIPRKGFWMLPFILMDSNDTTSDAISSMVIIQKMMMLVNETTVLIPPSPSLNIKLLSLITKKLDSVSCSKIPPLQCMQLLLDTLYKANFIHDSFYSLFQTWIKEMKNIKYNEPSVKLGHTIHNCLSLNVNPIVNQTKSQLQKVLKQTCVKSSIFQSYILSPNIGILTDILLVIVFNNPHHEAIPFLELMYRPMFPRILYCGPTPIDVPTAYKFRTSFILFENFAGYYMGSTSYRCAQQAMKLVHNVSGFLVIGDDVIFHPLKIHKMPFKKLCLMKNIQTADIQTKKVCLNKTESCSTTDHIWWGWEYHSDNNLQLSKYFINRSNIFMEYHNTLTYNNGLGLRMNAQGGSADMYYVPQAYASKFVELAGIFLKYKIFHEVAVPTMMYALEKKELIHNIDDCSVWDGTRNKPWENFFSLHRKDYMHPSKLGPIAKGPKEYRFYFCDKILPLMYRGQLKISDAGKKLHCH